MDKPWCSYPAWETMSEIKNRQDNPVPGIDYSEICIPDEHNLGTGTFTTVLEPGAMAKISPIISTIVAGIQVNG